MMRRANLLSLGLVALFPLLPTPRDQDSKRTSEALKALGWMAGRWVQEGEGQTLEERWDEPLGNNLTGTFRWLRGDSAWLYEFLLVEETKEGIHLTIRHFGPGSIGWEAKDAPLAFRLISNEKQRAVFESATREDPKQVVYERDGNVLKVRLVSRKEGKESVREFRFERR